jgi:acetate kinase
VHHFGAQASQARHLRASWQWGEPVCGAKWRLDRHHDGPHANGRNPDGDAVGDLDPGVIIYLLRNEKLDADKLETLLNHQSGLFGLSSGQSDVKTLEERARSGDPESALALDILAVAVRKVIGAYMALLGGIDVMVFTGGIGEHSNQIRSAATHGLEALGLTADKIQIIPTEEEQQIARHCRSLMAQNK